MKRVGLISALIYIGISVAAAASFFAATLGGEYTLIERLGGTAWVFILSMIILMPIVIPLVKAKIETVK